uniref:L-type lectin-like domain-containing protein n=1 Tax=Echinostoma caproni TaxID=27848 RepID=A0A183B7J7_9TREM
LTNDVRSQQGGISSTMPTTYVNWVIQIIFHVHGEGKHLYGDGFAFWYTQDPITFGNAFGAPPKFRGLGVFFDTYANQNGPHTHEHPYISVMVNNGSASYDHDRDGTLTAVAGCSSDFRGKPYSTVVLKYSGDDKEISCIAVDNVRLPVGYYFGLSAATGDLSGKPLFLVIVECLEVNTLERINPMERFKDNVGLKANSNSNSFGFVLFDPFNDGENRIDVHAMSNLNQMCNNGTSTNPVFSVFKPHATQNTNPRLFGFKHLRKPRQLSFAC